MSTKVVINGLGRIGRSILKLVIEEPALELVAVNDLVEAENLAYLLRFDTVYGRYPKTVTVEGGGLAIAGRKLRTLTERDPLSLPWKELGVELVFECTGALAQREDLEKHIRAGARWVLLSAPTHDGKRADRCPWDQCPAGHAKHHLLRELHDKLHYADRRSHRPAYRLSEGGNDDRACVYLVAVRRRWTEPALAPRARGGRESCPCHDWCRTGHDARSA